MSKRVISPEHPDAPPRNVIVDTDCGIDDAMALVLVLSHPEVRVLGITTVGGNTSLDNVVMNVAAAVDTVCGPVPAGGVCAPPIFRGCSRALMHIPHSASFFHGQDGLGDVRGRVDGHASSRFKAVDSAGHAVSALLRLVRGAPAQTVDLLCLAPLTNVALAVRLGGRDFVRRVRRITVMGGSTKLVGNTAACAEYNFFADPAAAAMVMAAEWRWPVRLVPWDMVIYAPLPWRAWSGLERHGRHTPTGRFVLSTHRHLVHYEHTHMSPRPAGHWVPDPLAAACMLAPQDCVRVRALMPAAVLIGTAPQDVCRGVVFVDRRAENGHTPGSEVDWHAYEAGVAAHVASGRPNKALAEDVMLEEVRTRTENAASAARTSRPCASGMPGVDHGIIPCLPNAEIVLTCDAQHLVTMLRETMARQEGFDALWGGKLPCSPTAPDAPWHSGIAPRAAL